MRDAGVTPTDDVLLVGHSHGGADAVNFAANPDVAGQYHITGVLTAGAPETLAYPKLDVPVLQVRTPGDVVPALGLDSGVGLLNGGPIGAVTASYLHDASVPGCWTRRAHALHRAPSNGIFGDLENIWDAVR